MRYFTTPSVREARQSVAWSLFFIFLLYFTAPAYAAFGKVEIYQNIIGQPIAALPDWIKNWQIISPYGVPWINIVDVNRDGILQWNEFRIHPDVVVLATPEIAGLPYVIAGLVAAGGLAAALSTADGLLLALANALSHDVYYKMIDRNAPTARRVMISKVLLLVVALAAAYVASLKIADILFLVSAAFSLAAAGFFPALVLGIFWKRATKWGAVLGMLSGVSITLYYMITTHPWMRGLFGVTDPIADYTWFGIAPIAAGIFGVPLAFAFIATLGPVGLVTVWLRTEFGINLRAMGFNLLSFWGLVITYLFFQIPLMILIITPALDGLKREWREAAAVLGATGVQYWRMVALPILFPSILGTFALLFANAFGAVATAFALTGPQLNIVPIKLFAQIRGDVLGNPNLGYALAFGMIVITAAANILYIWLRVRSERWLK
jgi:ABC-type uncharacterized transport system permease subunit